MNSINLVGRVTKDLELRHTNNNKAVCEFTLAVNRIGEGTDFVTCQVWKGQAENLVKYQGKGSLIGVLGSLRTENFKDKEGNTRYKTYVLVSTIEFLGSKKEENAQNNQNIVQNQQPDPFTAFAEQIDLDSDYLD
jgi:single-strand DNA-binding protein